MIQSKYFTFTVLFFFLGLISALLERHFYGGRLDENNIVQESFFLPLTFVFFLMAWFCFTLAVLKKLKQMKDMKQTDETKK